MPPNISSFDFIECHVCKGLGSPFYNYKMLGSNPLAENQGAGKESKFGKSSPDGRGEPETCLHCSLGEHVSGPMLLVGQIYPSQEPTS